ncbi:MAG TPA: cytochrome c biogenesis protein CcsA [Chthoniobacterales bacterium]|jgi:ABC-type transport system involved in cytochrome c biogenesis permease subunit|nr:cytochrome c biogenesis protein CcsA [Chthoniobacterales bacterium]
MKKLVPWIISVLLLGWAVSHMFPRRPASGFDVASFAKLPVLAGGRVMPLDTLARVSLSQMNHHGIDGTANNESSAQVATQSQWLVDVFMMPEHADIAKVFEVTNPDILDLFGWQKAGNYSFNDLQPFFGQIEQQAGLAAQTDSEGRNAFQRGIIKLRDVLRLYVQLKNTIQAQDSPDFGKEVQIFQQIVGPGLQAVRDRDAGKSYDQQAFERILLFTQRYQNLAQAKYALAIPNPAGKTENERWAPVSEALLASIGTGNISYPVIAYGRLISSYRNGDVAGFNQTLAEYQSFLKKHVSHELRRPILEYYFNSAQPFYQALILYLLVFVLALFSWLFWPSTLGRTALTLLGFTFVIHTAGLIIRMYIQGRPPITNLYSSAIFVGWASVLFCLILERIYRNGIGSVCGSVVGFVTLLIAQNLQFDGDTMEMLRAVLDTNAWLATHVVGEALGYSAVFLAGIIGIIYIIRGVFTTSFEENTAKSMGRMIYGVVCFATLFSLVATVLGGIWADQSWGRFWGWDPKENGALLVVLWNAIILHARWGGFARERGLAVLAVFGNVIGSLSWFGVNMLGVGLHSYGFMDQAFGPLLTFVGSQLAIMAIGLLPPKYWRGIRARAAKISSEATREPDPVTAS